MSARRSGPTLGIALTPGSVTAVHRGMATAWQRDVALNGEGNGSCDLLQSALSDAARASGIDEPRTVIALLPPLVELRIIALPPLPEIDRNRFLARNAARYFVGARGAQVVGSRPQTGVKAQAGGPVVVAAAAQQLMNAIASAAAAANVRVVGVVPAESAWAAAACAIWPALARGQAAVAITREDRTDLVTLDGGDLHSVRRFRGPADAAAIVASVSLAGTVRVGVIGPASAARAMSAALAAQGAQVSTPDAHWQAMAEQPEVLAARFAPETGGLIIRTEESVETERAHTGRLAWRVLAGAAATLLLAGLVHLFGVQRELASVQAARAAIRPQVEATLVGRSSVETVYRQVAGLADASREAPRWSGVLAHLAGQLPLDASITAFRARGDSIFLDGVALRAAPVFDDVARMPGITSVRATAPVRREAIEGEAPLEHFAIGAQLQSSAATRHPR